MENSNHQNAAADYVRDVINQAKKFKGDKWRASAIERLRSMAASLCLSRDFGQTNEVFDQSENGQCANYYAGIAQKLELEQ